MECSNAEEILSLKGLKDIVIRECCTVSLPCFCPTWFCKEIFSKAKGKVLKLCKSFVINKANKFVYLKKFLYFVSELRQLLKIIMKKKPFNIASHMKYKIDNDLKRSMNHR